MAEYIDRQEVIKKLEELDSRLMRGHYYDECEGVAMAKAIVNGVPAADVKMVAHGRWIRFKEHDSCYVHMRCSECSAYWSDPSHADSFRYCPNRGAKMDEEETT